MTPDKSTCTVTAWDIVTGKERWTRLVTDVEGADVGVSPDGQTVTALLIAGPAPFPTKIPHARVIDWDANTGVKLGQWDGPDGMAGRALVVTNTLFAVVDLATIVVIKRADASVLWNHTFPFSTSALCFSEDGNFVSYGFEDWVLYQRVGNDYQLQWTVSAGAPGQNFAGACGIANNLIVLAWYSGRYTQNQVQLYTTASSGSKVPVWTYMYPEDVGSTCQDLPVALSITPDAAYFVVGTWGPSNAASPQLSVFSSRQATPVWTYITPGSVFTVDITETQDGRVYVVSGGKHVHANIMGMGGDLYSIQLV